MDFIKKHWYAIVAAVIIFPSTYEVWTFGVTPVWTMPAILGLLIAHEIVKRKAGK
jgi:hypothetical protein